MLSSLAAEHEDVEETGEDAGQYGDEIEEYNSDGSDSLLTKIKPKPIAPDKTEEIDVYDSDNSESLLSQGKVTQGKKHQQFDDNRIRTWLKDANEAQTETAAKVHGCTSKERYNVIKGCGEFSGSNSEYRNLEDNSQSLLPSQAPNKSDKGELQESLISNRRKGRLCKQDKSGRKKVYREENVGASVCTNYSSCLPRKENSFKQVSPVERQKSQDPLLITPNQHSRLDALQPAHSTSSPYMQNFAQTRTGGITKFSNPYNTPQGSGFPSGVASPDDERDRSPDMIPGYRSHKHNNVDIQEDFPDPKSNESQWSDLNDSELLNLDDTGMIPKVSGEIETSTSRTCKTPGEFTSLKQSLFAKTPHFLKNSFHSKFSTPDQGDISTNSLWSEADDEQYLTLNMEDIQNMSRPTGFHDNSTATGTKFRRRSPNIQVLETPPSSPTYAPDVTYPESRSQLHPRSRSQKSLSPGNKRQTTMDDSEIQSKRRSTMDKFTVSPLKHSLAKLDFT